MRSAQSANCPRRSSQLQSQLMKSGLCELIVARRDCALHSPVYENLNHRSVAYLSMFIREFNVEEKIPTHNENIPIL